MKSKAESYVKGVKLNIQEVLKFFFNKKEVIPLIFIAGCSVISWMWGLEHWIFTLNCFLPYENIIFFLFLLFCLAGLVFIHNHLTLQENNYFAESIIALCMGGLTIYFSLLSWQSVPFQQFLALSTTFDMIGLMNAVLLYGIFFMAILGDLWISFQIITILNCINLIDLPAYAIVLGKGILSIISLGIFGLGIISWVLEGDSQALGLNLSIYEISILSLAIFMIIVLFGVLDWILSPVHSMSQDYSPKSYLEILKKNFRGYTTRWGKTVWFITGLFFIFVSLVNELLWEFYYMFLVGIPEIAYLSHDLFVGLLLLAIVGLSVNLEFFHMIFEYIKPRIHNKRL